VTRIVELASRGRLIVATDLQGNLADFERVESIFEDACQDSDGATLVVTGDLVHGPEIPESMWPEYLGSYYRGDSGALLDRAEALQQRHPGRVHYLLGNHEHAHVGGPIVSKFFPNEAERLEDIIGDRRSSALRRWLASWPLVALARDAGIAMLHAAPNAEIVSAEDIERIAIWPSADPVDLDSHLAEILWARTATTARARGFLRALGPELAVAVYGHDVAREGYAIDREPLLCISTSFGCFDGDKLYLDWDLSRRADSARHLVEVGLRPLYPHATPIHRERLAHERRAIQLGKGESAPPPLD
jgi:hypothetical protein